MMQRIFSFVMAGFATLALSNAAAAQVNNQAFPPVNQSTCVEGSVMTWAGPGSHVECKGLTAACLSYMQAYYGTAQTFKFYPEFTSRLVSGAWKQVPTGNWDCVPR